MHVTIAKVDQNLFDGEADSLTVPGTDGEMTILPEHMPIVTTLKAGTITVHGTQGEQQFPIKGGVLEVRRDGATVIL